MTFRLNADGKQYVVISAGGARLAVGQGGKPADYVIAFALP